MSEKIIYKPLRVKIFSIFFRPFKAFHVNPFIPIQAGKSGSKYNLGFLGDDTGENISHKNKTFSELTAYYWVWKNIKSEYIGFCHYRRYLNFLSPKDKCKAISANSKKLYVNLTHSIPAIENYLHEYDLILPQRHNLENSISQLYQTHFSASDWEHFTDTITKLYPQLQTISDKTFNENRYIYYMLFITKWEYFDEFMTMLFNIFSDLEPKISVSNNPYKSRVFAFLAERFYNLYIQHLIDEKRVKYLELPFYTIKDSLIIKYYLFFIKRAYRLFGRFHYFDSFKPA